MTDPRHRRYPPDGAHPHDAEHHAAPDINMDDDPLEELERLVSKGGPTRRREPPRQHYEEHDPYAGQHYAQQDQQDFFEGQDVHLRGRADDHQQGYYDEQNYGQDQYYAQGYAADPQYSDDGHMPPHSPAVEEQLRGSGRSRGFMTIAVVLGVVAVGGVGAAGLHYLHRDRIVASSNPPLIKADPNPARIMPQPGQTADDSQPGKLIYDRVGEGGEKVVGGAEEPLERPPATPRDVSRVIVPGQGDPAQQPAAKGEPAASPAPSASDAESRLVRTFVVKPEGNQDAAPVLDPSASQPASSGPAAGMSIAGDGAVGIMVGGEEEGGATTSAHNAPAAQAEAPPAEVPVPLPRPRNLAQAAVPPQAPATAAPGAPLQTAPQLTAPQASAASASARGIFIQITSQRTEAEARAAYGNLQQRFPGILRAYQPSVKPVDLGERGTFYRVRIGPFTSFDEAGGVCGNLKSAGGECIVQKE